MSSKEPEADGTHWLKREMSQMELEKNTNNP